MQAHPVLDCFLSRIRLDAADLVRHSSDVAALKFPANATILELMKKVLIIEDHGDMLPYITLQCARGLEGIGGKGIDKIAQPVAVI